MDVADDECWVIVMLTFVFNPCYRVSAGYVRTKKLEGARKAECSYCIALWGGLPSLEYKVGCLSPRV